ncbi:IS3 family transposase [Reichenbachiella agarivorans]|uniref:IS3 family transposase n=2 Tax=Reichenbachiella agarivorans TaxID=2979464 RepID=A0ABY6CT22_9BACT|nr:IS3 family transposase [Reichenbachiella agarivorans]UXP30692.1 IS3 family transposase [Reichenbachiella agarivorans]UXP32022.1 IS3 family transposase [Reichenbachiella agarivorans]UXP33048.1 IS3 family transposase [Reichenbachiella agarivorans]UXP33672.1 IS3 family transposase [Reichenbachiella agarivorans]
MKANHDKHSVEKMCRVFKVSRSGYYRWLHHKPSKRYKQRKQLMEDIKKVHLSSKQRYGSPKVTDDLQDMGWKVSRQRVARIMRAEGIRSIVVKKFRGVTTDSKHSFPLAENHLNRDFHAEGPGQKWVSDITYIPTKQGWLYLTIVMDLYDRKIVGWSLSTTMTTQATVLAAWKMAIKNRPITKALLFHSDRGVQYAAYAFSDHLKREGVKQSMSRKGNCWDNAVAESFFKILKSEMVSHVNYYSILQAKTQIFEFIEVWYNRKRKHAYLGYKTPDEFGEDNYSKCA